ncbi:MAG: ABC transporter ATP-binding protein [Gammaproteobacteria bacterium WSBS_2016_MAG_OTU1]
MSDNFHVVFENVQKSYDGESLVVRNLNLQVGDGEFLTMLGPSGSGKTTSLMMLAGFETLTSGEIYIKNEPISGIPPHKRGIGMVFQNYALFPHMTVGENLAFPLEVRGLGEDDVKKKVTNALDMVQLADFERRLPGQLSGGQQQRVAVARALVFEPSLVLMDEPLGALDKHLREQMQYELKHIHEQLGVTMVYVTHDQGEALILSDRIAVFSDGVIQQIATPDTLYESPENAFVAHFIGENNRFIGDVKSRDGDLCQVETGGKDMRALCVNADSGGKTTLSLRPERVFIGNPPEAADINRVEGKICERIYMGDHIRVRLSLLGTDEFIVKVPNNARQVELKIGEIASLWWYSQDCRALDYSA